MFQKGVSWKIIVFQNDVHSLCQWRHTGLWWYSSGIAARPETLHMERNQHPLRGRQERSFASKCAKKPQTVAGFPDTKWPNVIFTGRIGFWVQKEPVLLVLLSLRRVCSSSLRQWTLWQSYSLTFVSVCLIATWPLCSKEWWQLIHPSLR